MLETNSIGEIWLQASQYVLEHGKKIQYRDTHLIECLNLQLVMKEPIEDDSIITKYGDKNMLDYMEKNFQTLANIQERGYSYKKRIFDYDGLNQMEYAIQNLQKRENSMDGIFSLLAPKEDENHVPCLALIQILVREDTFIVTMTFKSIDIGKKCYGDFLEILKLFKPIQDNLKIPKIKLVANITSAHIYQEDLAQVKNIVIDFQKKK